MKGFGYSIFLLFAISFSSVLTTTNPCRFVTNNAYINNPSACNAYFKCVKGKAVQGNCPIDFWFDKYSGECDYQENVECTDAELVHPCKARCKGPNACLIANPHSCTGYFHCKDGESQQEECSPGTVFHPIEKRCVIEKDFECKDEVEETTKETVCNNIPNGIYVRNTVDCGIYHICNGGTASEEFTCAEGLHFNLESGRCDTIDLVQCNIAEDSAEAIAEDIAEIVPIDAEPTCDGKNEEFTSDPDSCAGWYFCRNNKPEHSGKCPEHTWFNGKDTCEREHLVPEDVCRNRCEEKQSGFVLKPSTKCKEYYQCSGGQISGAQLTCDIGQVFDLDLEMCIDDTRSFICPK